MVTSNSDYGNVLESEKDNNNISSSSSSNKKGSTYAYTHIGLNEDFKMYGDFDILKKIHRINNL